MLVLCTRKEYIHIYTYHKSPEKTFLFRRNENQHMNISSRDGTALDYFLELAFLVDLSQIGKKKTWRENQLSYRLHIDSIFDLKQSRVPGLELPPL